MPYLSEKLAANEMDVHSIDSVSSRATERNRRMHCRFEINESSRASDQREDLGTERRLLVAVVLAHRQNRATLRVQSPRTESVAHSTLSNRLGQCQ